MSKDNEVKPSGNQDSQYCIDQGVSRSSGIDPDCYQKQTDDSEPLQVQDFSHLSFLRRFIKFADSILERLGFYTVEFLNGMLFMGFSLVALRAIERFFFS